MRNALQTGMNGMSTLKKSRNPIRNGWKTWTKGMIEEGEKLFKQENPSTHLSPTVIPRRRISYGERSTITKLQKTKVNFVCKRRFQREKKYWKSFNCQINYKIHNEQFDQLAFSTSNKKVGENQNFRIKRYCISWQYLMWTCWTNWTVKVAPRALISRYHARVEWTAKHVAMLLVALVVFVLQQLHKVGRTHAIHSTTVAHC